MGFIRKKFFIFKGSLFFKLACDNELKIIRKFFTLKALSDKMIYGLDGTSGYQGIWRRRGRY